MLKQTSAVVSKFLRNPRETKETPDDPNMQCNDTIKERINLSFGQIALVRCHHHGEKSDAVQHS